MMIKGLRIPLRFKILVTQLLVVTVVLGLITYTMARMFHTDKTAYIHDLISIIAVHTAEEADSLLDGYRKPLKVFSQIMVDREIPSPRKQEMLNKLFDDFRDFVIVALYEDGKELGAVFDAAAFENTGTTREALAEFRKQHPLPLQQILNGNVYIENSTISPELPVLTMAFVEPGLIEGRTIIAAGTIRLEKLLRLAGRSKVFETFLIDGDGTLLAHSNPVNVFNRTGIEWISKLKSLYEGKSLGGSMEYEHNGIEMVGGVSPVRTGNLLMGVQLEKKSAYLTARELLNTLVGVSLLLLVSAGLLSLFWSHRLTRPIEMLSKATRIVAKGNFDINLKSSSKDEIGELSESFNTMATELKGAQAALVQSEKMAAFGQLGAGIAHEVKNPLFGILGLAQLSLRKADKDSIVHKNLSIIEKETRRCKEIIENLLKFARQEKVEFNRIDLSQVAEDSAAIVHHQLGTHQIKLKKDITPSLPRIMGNANQIQQVLMNLMINSQQAMKGKPGQVELSTRLADPGHVEIRVSDNGPGIPREHLDKIFEPFFTTKPAGTGTGLGLSVTYGIIKDHSGEVKVESEPGQGATFIMTFPVNENGTPQTTDNTESHENRQRRSA